MTTVAGAEAAAARALLVAAVAAMIVTAGTALGRLTAAARWPSGTVIKTTSVSMTSGTRCEAQAPGEALQRQGEAATVTVSVIGQRERAVITAATLAAEQAVSTAALQASSSNSSSSSSSMHNTMATTAMMEELAAAALLAMQVAAATPTPTFKSSTATAMQAAAMGFITMSVVVAVVLEVQSMATSAAAAAPAAAAAGRACNLRLLLQQLGLAVSTPQCRCVLLPATPTLAHRRRSSTGGLGLERTVGRTKAATAGGRGLAAAI